MMEERDMFGDVTGTYYHAQQDEELILAGSVMLDSIEEEESYTPAYQTPSRSSDEPDIVALVLAIGLLLFFAWMIGYALVNAF